ncbi:LacI family transcriptional regulator [Cohnella xylanilytica]|uniref:LacI family DNA-binding transcriptional regulator n=1 Tax=Cohnella xylanilytica TaxID=557555 RepID=UPI001B0AA613|nr:LacI family DNA-binding transcriptional regulator [Cohnella xylanilytica]GIO12105.1 LacI family transcriptional regulator [Cohnella xylanilytica]
MESVAERAGVSRATAARILGGYSGSRSKARARVLQAAEELGYKPNKLAKSLASRRSFKIGVILPDIENAYFARLYRGVERVCHNAGYTVTLGISGENAEQELLLLQDMLSEQVEGIVVAPSDGLKGLTESTVPVVSVDRMPANEMAGDGWVTTDNYDSAYRATAALIDAGYRRLSLLLNLPHISTTHERIAGASEAAAERGLLIDRHVMASHLLDDIVPAIADYLSEAKPDAVIAGDAVICTAVVIAARKLGIHLGDEMGLVTYDDEPWMSLLEPAISTIEQPVYEIGETAASLLMSRINGSLEGERHIRLSSLLKLRGSVRALKP